MSFANFFFSNDMCSDELNDYDAVNDETFGVTNTNIESYDDLEELSKITAGLNMDGISTDNVKNKHFFQNNVPSTQNNNYNPKKNQTFAPNASLLTVEELEQKMLLESSILNGSRNFFPSTTNTSFKPIQNNQLKPIQSTNDSSNDNFFPFQNIVTNPSNNFLKNIQQKLIPRHNKPKSLPSNKTIFDFAFDPYAGLMSKKEREWLIKINIIQYAGTGNAYENDFYYTVWKKRNFPNGMTVVPKKKEIPRYYSYDDIQPSTYTISSFTGALGKLTHYSAKIPRQIIDLSFDIFGDEDTDVNSGKSLQKKLKAMLVRIENIALALLKCEDLKRNIYEQNENDKSLLQNNLKKELNLIITNLCLFEILPTMMMIQKGRSLIFNVMEFCESEDTFKILKLLVESLHKFGKKIPEESFFDYSKHTFNIYSKLNKQQCLEIINYFKFDMLQASMNMILISTCLISLIFVVKHKKNILEISESMIYKLLSSDGNNKITDFINLFFTYKFFLTEDLLNFKQCLISEFLCSKNVAETIILAIN